MDIQAASILTLIIINAVLLTCLAASRSELTFWKDRADGEKKDRIEYQRRLDSSVEKLGKQNRLIRAMSLSNGFEDPIDEDDDE